ncbi:N-acetylmuramoyl-L-alanine amidase [[Clostridium] innocuum]|nr:N-acetylmuramoyl-L-alanine amidase [[Clostridium] innocuum]
MRKLQSAHGGYDTGSISYDGVYEKDITLAITQKTGELLQKAGYSVVYTRIDDEVSWSDDNKDDLRTRVAIAEEAAADYYISIHTNASTYGDGASGFEAYLNYENETIAAMASSIESNLMELQYTQSRGLKSTEDTSLYVIDSNSVPAMLLELGFITDSADAAYMSSEDGQNAIAQSIAQGIMEHL